MDARPPISHRMTDKTVGLRAWGLADANSDEDNLGFGVNHGVFDTLSKAFSSGGATHGQ